MTDTRWGSGGGGNKRAVAKKATALAAPANFIAKNKKNGDPRAIAAPFFLGGSDYSMILLRISHQSLL